MLDDRPRIRDAGSPIGDTVEQHVSDRVVYIRSVTDLDLAALNGPSNAGL